MVFDEFIGRARFRLWSSSSPQVHPFYVTARLPVKSNAISSLAFQAFGASLKPSIPISVVSSPVLVEPARSARLHLHSAHSNILLEVKPLQRGRLGEVIRVRLPANGKTFRARVLANDELDADY